MASTDFNQQLHRPGLGPNVTSDDLDAGIADLIREFQFSPNDGRIWLGDARMVLIHSEALATLREELIDLFGLSRTRGLLTRMGYTQGGLDAQLARRVRRDENHFDAFKAGPQLHSLEGVVTVEEVRTEIDVASGKYYGEYLWHDSTEAIDHVAFYGIGKQPVCWAQIGYSSGYSTAFFGQPILFREIECRAMGFDSCKIIGKPVNEWQDLDEVELAYFSPEPFVHHPAGGQIADNDPESLASQLNDPFALVGVSPGFKQACHLLDRVAATDTPVLFLGESGVGKEVFARNLHRISQRHNGPFVAVNCAAIPEDLVEAELFGVVKGAYTGATKDRAGRFERADGGILFLDEVSSLSYAAQGKLLRALQDLEIEKVGGSAPQKVDVRVIAACNNNLAQQVRAGQFRHDLYYRLNVFPISIPPLRERQEDIPLLMNLIRKKVSVRYNKPLGGFTEAAINALQDYAWPGNIRELENMVERGVVLAAEGEAVDVEHLFFHTEPLAEEIVSAETPSHPEPLPLFELLEQLKQSGLTFEQLEVKILNRAVDNSGGNLAKAARALGMTRPQLAYRLDKYGTDKSD